MANLQPVAFRLAIIIVMINVFLFIGGLIPASQVPTISRILTGVSITDANTAAFQQNLQVTTSSGTSIGDTSGDSSISSILDFITLIPIIGPIIDLFRLLYELLFTSALGLVVVMQRAGFPSQIIIASGALSVLIFTIALYEMVMSFISQRGGTK